MRRQRDRRRDKGAGTMGMGSHWGFGKVEALGSPLQVSKGLPWRNTKADALDFGATTHWH